MKVNLVLLFGFVAVIWVVEFVNLFTGHALNQYGNFPRTVQGLRGIPLGPFILGSIGHVLANTPPLLILGGLSALRGREAFPWASLFIILAGGAGVWAFGRSALISGPAGWSSDTLATWLEGAGTIRASYLSWWPLRSSWCSAGEC